eukprot:m.322774 g.322774  ORF g.322774 m.322774 type:complete len:58 (+) comp27571_c0_seq1:93-266(+)
MLLHSKVQAFERVLLEDLDRDLAGDRAGAGASRALLWRWDLLLPLLFGRSAAPLPLF